jgi:signal transduction histidine kinase
MATQFAPQFTSQEECSRDILHELKAPISRIKILLQCARQSPQQMNSYLARIEENVVRLQELTNGLLDLSRMTGKTCDLAELLLPVVEDARIEAESRGCAINFLPIVGCFVYADGESLRSAVENVLRNAIQYTKSDSSVSLVLSRSANGIVQILVKDEGPGVPENELQEIFKPFYRATHTRAHTHAPNDAHGDPCHSARNYAYNYESLNGTHGAGLGLAIAHRVVTLHGGTITARNRSNAPGLEITIQLPLITKSHPAFALR